MGSLYRCRCGNRPVSDTYPPVFSATIGRSSCRDAISAKGNPGLPVRLLIPHIAVDAPIYAVGLTSSGAMDAPKGPDDTGWYALGPRPGEAGSAVIDGHFGWKGNIPAIFDRLHTLRAGDTVSVVDESGSIRTFVVRALRIYGEHDDASEVFVSTDGKVHLNLITCGGTWNKNSRSYSDRLVVFTDEV